MGRWAAVAGAVVVVVLGVWKVLPWMRLEHPSVVGSPSLGGVIGLNPAVVPRGRSACVEPVPLTGDIREVQVLVDAGRGPAPIDVELSAPGYRATGRIAANYGIGGYVAVSAPVRNPPPGDLVGRVCVHNGGRSAIRLAGTNEPRSQVFAVTKVGKRVQPDISLSFYGTKTSVLGQLGTIVDRATALTGFLPAFLVWIFLIALLIGVPAGVLFALSDRRVGEVPVAEPAEDVADDADESPAVVAAPRAP
jgi:hypothetical protein